MIQMQIILALLVLARVSAFIAFFSLFSNRQLPNTVKIGLAVGLTFFWYGEVDVAVMLPHGAPEGLVLTLLWVVREVTIGLVLATAMNAFFFPAKIAGRLRRPGTRFVIGIRRGPGKSRFVHHADANF